MTRACIIHDEPGNGGAREKKELNQAINSPAEKSEFPKKAHFTLRHANEKKRASPAGRSVARRESSARNAGTLTNKPASAPARRSYCSRRVNQILNMPPGDARTLGAVRPTRSFAASPFDCLFIGVAVTFGEERSIGTDDAAPGKSGAQSKMNGAVICARQSRAPDRNLPRYKKGRQRSGAVRDVKSEEELDKAANRRTLCPTQYGTRGFLIKEDEKPPRRRAASNIRAAFSLERRPAG